MRSPADGARRLLEQAARAVALGLLLWLAVVVFLDRRAPAHDEARSGELKDALPRWSTSSAPAGVHVRLEAPLAPHARDWLRALAGVGSAVTWEGTAPVPTALSAEPVADPEGGTNAWIAAPAGAGVSMEDAAGRLDSIRSGSAGARMLVRSAPNDLAARSGASIARSSVLDSLVLGRLLLLGRAGWESKFVAAALEERGWKLDARLALSPRGDVRQGSPATIDTARYSAVIVLDSIGTADAIRIAAYARSGGGVVLAGGALRVPGLAGLSAGIPGTAEPGHQPFDSSATVPRRGLEVIPISPRPDAVVLERRGIRVAVAARRVERGRAVSTGYIDTWRWRLGGGASAVQDHRDWWAGLVAGVAHVGRVPRRPETTTDEAPLATMISRLGPSAGRPAPQPGSNAVSERLLFALLMAALLIEWTSRRLRGVP